MVRKLICALIPFGLLCCSSGCSLGSLRNQEDPVLYLLEADLSSIKPLPKQLSTGLIISETTAARYINSQKLLHRSIPNTISNYKFASWAEPPPARFTALLLIALERSNLFRQVTRTTTTNGMELNLSCEIIDFIHDALSEPGFSKASVRCELTRLKDKAPLTSSYFEETVPAASYDAKGAVEALEKATSGLLQQIVDWLISESRKNFRQF